MRTASSGKEMRICRDRRHIVFITLLCCTRRGMGDSRLALKLYRRLAVTADSRVLIDLLDSALQLSGGEAGRFDVPDERQPDLPFVGKTNRDAIGDAGRDIVDFN